MTNHIGHVCLIEDDEDLRNSICDLLVFANYHVLAWADPKTFLDELPHIAPAVVITDMRMPGMPGVEMHQELLARGRLMPVIYISGESTVRQSIEAMRLGALDFLLKPIGREELLKAVAAGIEKDRAQMHQIIQKARVEEALKLLSPREREVHALLLLGFGNAEIVSKLGISLYTAKQYKSEVMRKLQVRSLAQLIEFSRST